MKCVPINSLCMWILSGSWSLGHTRQWSWGPGNSREGVHRESCAIMRRNRIHKVRFLLGCRACPWLALAKHIKEGGVREASRSMDKILESREMDLFERRKKIENDMILKTLQLGNSWEWKPKNREVCVGGLLLWGQDSCFTGTDSEHVLERNISQQEAPVHHGDTNGLQGTAKVPSLLPSAPSILRTPGLRVEGHALISCDI